jgi:hypothetical protein
MRKFKIAGVLRVLALMLVVTVGWCYIRDRMSVDNWKVPIDYAGDSPQVIGWIKAAAEGDYVPFSGKPISRLGAPYTAEWNDFPMFERPMTYVMGLLSKIFGLFVACNVSVLLAYVTSAVSFYLCCRFLKYSILWSWVGAVLFAFTYYHYWKGLGHLLQAFSYTLPWAVLSCWIVVGSKRIRLGDKLSIICFVTATVMGFSNSYNMSLFMQLLGLSVLAQFFSRRRKENLKVGVIMLGLTVVSFLALNIGTLTYQFVHGKNPAAMDRHYFEAELYALKPMEFFIPPRTHNIESLAMMGKYYASQQYVHSETFSVYLGIIGIIGLVWIMVESFLLITRGRNWSKPFPPYAVQIIWMIMYSIIGGFNCLASISGIQLLRSTNRCSIVISTMILMFLVSRMTVWSRRFSASFSYALAGLVLLIGLVDQMPRPKPDSDTVNDGKIVESDKVFGALMEQKLPPNSMVFQLPVMVYPEAVPTHDVTGYEMLRPYFVTKTLRFSFGSVRGRNREAWQWEVEKLPVPEMVATLEKYGFAAIYINRKGYADHGDELIKQLAAIGKNVVCEDPLHDQVCIALQPASKPELPHTDDWAQLIFRSGWAIKEHNPLQNREWSTGDATVTFFSEPHELNSYNVHCVVGSIETRRVSLEMDGREIWSAEVGAGQGVPLDVTVTGHHGNNTLKFKTDTAPSQVKESELPLAFTLMNLQVTRLH